MKRIIFFLTIYSALILSLSAQTSEFSYQGFITDNNAPANGLYDIDFRLYADAAGGSILATQSKPAVSVTNGVFTVTLNFGDFPGADRYIELAVRPAGVGSMTVLAPRSKVLSAPMATVAKNATQLAGTNANQYVLTTDPRMSDARNPLPNSANYVQNRTTPQAGTNFNISGNGNVGGTLTGDIVSASSQFNLGLNRVVGKVGQNNLFFGTLAGNANGGIQNTMLGDSAGRDNTGNENVLIGFVSGQVSTGNNNTFVGSRSGLANSTGSDNTLMGANADLGGGTFTNATAIGADAFVEQSNSLVLGSVNGENTATSDVSVGIGTTTPAGSLDIAGQFPNAPPNISNLRLTNFGRFSLIRGRTSRGTRTAPTATQTNDPLFVITADGYTGSAFTNFGQATLFFSATENWTSSANGTSIKLNTTPNGSIAEATRMLINHDGQVAIGDFTPTRKLDVDGIIRVGGITGTVGCIEDRDGTVIAGTCASDARFKKNVRPFGSVLASFARLQPVNYFWRTEEFADQHFGTHQSFGLIAQDVEKLFPELVATDEKGYKAINYSKLPLYTIQAVKELKTENDALKLKLDRQQTQIDELVKIVRTRGSHVRKQPRRKEAK